MPPKKRKKPEKFFEIALPDLKTLPGFGKLINVPKEEGYLVSGTSVSPWYFTGVRNNQGMFSMYAPFIKSVSLGEMITKAPHEALEAVRLLGKACQALMAYGKLDAEISFDTVYFLENGQVLFLPPEIFRKLRDLYPADYKTAFWRINNPYQDDFQSKTSHTIAALAYKILTGVFPFEGKTAEEIRTRLRLAHVVPAQHINPLIKDSIARELTEYFQNRKIVPRSLVSWENLISAWLENGLYCQRSRSDRSLLKTEKKKSVLTIEKKLMRAVFWEKNGRTIGLALLGISVGITIVIAVLSSIFRPNPTHGFPPDEIVAAYYDSMNTLNTELMRDCVTEEAGKNELWRTEMMFITMGQRIAYERVSYRIPADLWALNDKPRIDLPYFIDGVADLTVTRLQDEPNPVFLAEYDRFRLEEGNDVVEPEWGAHYHSREKLYLKKVNTDWKIYKIVTLEFARIQKNQ